MTRLAITHHGRRVTVWDVEPQDLTESPLDPDNDTARHNGATADAAETAAIKAAGWWRGIEAAEVWIRERAS